MGSTISPRLLILRVLRGGGGGECGGTTCTTHCEYWSILNVLDAVMLSATTATCSCAPKSIDVLVFITWFSYVLTAQLSHYTHQSMKTNIDPKFIELTADVFFTSCFQNTGSTVGWNNTYLVHVSAVYNSQYYYQQYRSPDKKRGKKKGRLIIAGIQEI